MIWYILISLLLIFLLWLLFVPVIIYTHTDKKRYLLTLQGIFRAVVVPVEGLYHIRGWIFFIPFKYNPFRKKKRTEKGRPKKPRKKNRKWRGGSLQAMKGVLRAFRIRKLEANIDTEDFILNAQLVPIFSAVNGENIRLQVNFEGHQSLLLDLRVTLGALLWTVIKIKYNSTINH